MNQLYARRWTSFQIEAEVDMFGVQRIVDAHNAMVDKAAQLRQALSLHRVMVASGEDESNESKEIYADAMTWPGGE